MKDDDAIARSRDERTVEAAAKLLASTLGASAASRNDAYARRRLDDRLARARSGGPGIVHVATAAAVAAVAVLLVIGWQRWTAPLRYVAEAGTDSWGYVRTLPRAAATVTFSDGSTIAVGATARARVVATDARGARLALDEGRLHVRIVPRRHARWSIAAGPFTVHVTGTEFDVRWSGGARELVVGMHAGSVVVDGPLAPNGLSVIAGQQLRARLGSVEQPGAIAIADIGAAPATREAHAPGRADGVDPPSTPNPSSSADVPVAGADEPRASPKRRRPSPPPTPGAPSVAPPWSARMASGDFASVLAEADARGIGSILAAGSLSELMALADAARYGRRSDLADRSWAAVRRRFPSTPEAHEAAFFLGRLAEDGRHDRAAALSWYARYLAEAHDGAYAGEALGRQMLATHATGEVEAARALAARYLTRFPDGTYAAAARRLAAR